MDLSRANQRGWLVGANGGGVSLISANSRLAVAAPGTVDGGLTQQPDTDAGTQRWTFTAR